jgi:ABC-2 type transport system ATP-binding protein
MQNILSVKNLTKKFNDFYAVENISFYIEEGEILGLLGPNGAGKTTTIQMLLGVMSPTSGEVMYYNKKLSEKRNEIMEEVNFSSTYVDLPHDLNVKEIISYTARFYKLHDYKLKIEEILSQFKLKDLANRQVKTLSAGQKTRLHLAKSFVNDPNLLLLDEPTASLDPDIADYIRKFIISKKQNSNLSVLFTSHNMAEVTQVCDRVIFLKKGKIIANDTPEKLAQKIDLVQIKLLFETQEDISSFLQDKDINFEIENKYFIVKVEEDKIHKTLKLISDKFKYNEISIEKPSLEDYFLKLARESNE